MENFNLSFDEAITACLVNKGYIRGDNFGKGVFVKNVDGTLVTCQKGEGRYDNVGNFHISIGTVSQKYRLFDVANDSETGRV